MNLLSWNVRGLGRSGKRKDLKLFVKNRNIDMMFIQETKLEAMNHSLVSNIIGFDNFAFNFVPSTGSAGGVLSVWDANFVFCDKVRKEGNWILIKGKTKNVDHSSVFVNVYAPNSESLRRNLWQELLNLKLEFIGPWIICGDFNCVRTIEERKDCVGLSREMMEFDKFIIDSGLVDLPLVGRKYTWPCSRGYMSRIDRFLVAPEWINGDFNLIQRGLAKNFSDHAPICLGSDISNWGAKPFCFFQSLD